MAYVFDKAMVESLKTNTRGFFALSAAERVCLAMALPLNGVDMKYSEGWARRTKERDNLHEDRVYRIRPDWQPPEPEPEPEFETYALEWDAWREALYWDIAPHACMRREDHGGFQFADGTIDHQHFRAQDGTPAVAWRRRVR